MYVCYDHDFCALTLHAPRYESAPQRHLCDGNGAARLLAASLRIGLHARGVQNVWYELRCVLWSLFMVLRGSPELIVPL